MHKEEIIEKINGFLIEEFELEEDQLQPEANLKSTLGIDSLDFVDLIVIIEKTFGFKVKGEDLAQVQTLEEFYQYICNRLNVN
ncbi:MAG: acyl carrier protein [Bacteroidota bacterium]